ncbi:MAG: DUF5683 domain-containing protein [Mucilaginibacter sp.]
MYRYFLTTICFVLFAIAVKAQALDTTAKKTTVDPMLQSRRDSVKANPIVPKVKERVYHPDSTHSPHKAVMHSLMIPGWGQVYNHRWWKVPAIYTGLGLLAWAYFFNVDYYNETLSVAKHREKGDLPVVGEKYYSSYYLYAPYSTEAINSAVIGARRNRDLAVIGFVAAWGINMIDAYIDAKFIHSYTMDNNLSFKVKPSLITPPVYAGNFNSSVIPALKITFTFN